MTSKELKELRKEIREVLQQLRKEGSEHISCTFWQDQPWTAARVIVTHPDLPVRTALGFAKVRYPDTFDAKFGRDLCVRKALGTIAKGLAQELADREDKDETDVVGEVQG